MTADLAGVTVGGLLRSRPESLGRLLDLLTSGDRLDLRITNPYGHGHALAGFHEYLHSGRVLVLGGSELRDVESLPSSARAETTGKTFTHEPGGEG